MNAYDRELIRDCACFLWLVFLVLLTGVVAG